MNVKQMRDAALKAARDICDQAKIDGRDLTPDEVATVEGHIAKADNYQAQMDRAATGNAAIKAMNGFRAPADDRPMFTDDEKARILVAFKSSAPFYADNVPLPARRKALTKAAHVTGTLIPPSPNPDVLTDPDPSVAVALRDLFPPAEAVTSPTQRVYRVGIPTGTDGDPVQVVGEGELKPEANVATTYEDLEVLKIATTFKTSDELASDAAFLLKAIQASILRAVLARENALVWDALQSTSGILSYAGAAGMPVVDAVAAAIAQSEALNGITPSALVMSPYDVAAVRQAKAAGSGDYISDPLTAGPTGLHGLTITSTPAATQGEIYMLTGTDFGRFFTIGGLRVEVGHVDDDFRRNVTTCRVEERVLPVVTQPNLVTKVTVS